MSSPFKLPQIPGLDAVKPHWTNYFNPHTLPVEGDLAACVELASCFEQGKYVERNMDLVSALYEECCNKGEGACCARKGEYYAKTPEAALSLSCWWKHSTARELFEKGCEAGDSRSCGSLSDLLFTKNCVRDKLGAKKALAKAIAIAKGSCYEGKKAHQCWVLGGFLYDAAALEEANQDQLITEANKALQVGADVFQERCKTNGQDCYFLGELLREKYRSFTVYILMFCGIVFVLTALRYTRTTSRKPKGEATALQAYQHTKIEPPPEVVADLARAKRAYEDGCLKLNDVESCTALAQMFSAGSSVTVRDAELVMSYLARSCHLSQMHCGLLGEFFAEYPQFQPPSSEGIERALFNLACNAGNKQACARHMRLMKQDHIQMPR